MSIKRNKKFNRMTIPKSEFDFQIIEEEIQLHEINQEAAERRYDQEREDLSTFLLNTIVHTLSHVESDINSINMRLRELNESLSEIKSLLNSLVKAVILKELPNEKAKRKLMLNILRDLKE